MPERYKAIKATRILGKFLRTVARIASVAVVAAFLVSSRIPTELESLQASGELHMISRNGPTTYYEAAGGTTGFEYEIAKRFADYLGVNLVIHDEENLGEMIERVSEDDYHFAAAGLTITDQREQKVRFTDPYMEITQQLIYRAGDERPETTSDLIGKDILVIGNSSHSENLRRLKKYEPELTWRERSDLEMLDLLEMIHNGEVDITIVDSNAYEINSSLYPQARVAFDISEPESLAWAFNRKNDTSLYNEAQKFFQQIKQQGVIEDTYDTYYGHLGELNYSGALLFTKRLNSRLPKWKEKLQLAAQENQLDWALLAALSYQESHWNPKAKSRTGVRGFMMLTRGTAKDMGVKNRLDADESIAGGAKYFKKILSRIPDRIQYPDRTWLALAAYNMGFGHVEDARILTEHHGGNPDKWSDVKENILLLSKRKYYKFTKHGYARGWEAVDYVQNIRNFHTIIAWHEKEELQSIALNNMNETEFAEFSPVVTEAVKSFTVESL